VPNLLFMALKLLICMPPLLVVPPSATLTKLPVVSFSVVKSLKGGKEDLECSVCLEKFAEDESLRLLSKYNHIFHSECIDVWFLSHSTYPLCRVSLKPTFEEISTGVPEIGEVSRSILVAQELFHSRPSPPPHRRSAAPSSLRLPLIDVHSCRCATPLRLTQYLATSLAATSSLTATTSLTATCRSFSQSQPEHAQTPLPSQEHLRVANPLRRRFSKECANLAKFRP
jgi:hypothetical protein